MDIVILKKTEDKEGFYEINEEEAKVGRMIFDFFINKLLSIREIVRKLTQLKIPARNNRGKWARSTVSKIIRNETYAGTTYYNKYESVEPTKHNKETKYRKQQKTGRKMRPKEQWFPITVPAIISKDIFDLAQKQLARNSDFSPRNVKNRYLLRGLVKCGNCGSLYFGTPCHKQLFYRCGERYSSFPLPKQCNASMISAQFLENLVWDEVCKAMKQPEIIIGQIEKSQERSKSEVKSIVKETEQKERDIANIKCEEDRILDLYRTGFITMEKLKEQMKKIKEKENILNNEKTTLLEKKENGVSLSLAKKSIKTYSHIIEDRLETFTFEERQKFLRLLIDKITLEKQSVRIKGVIPVCQDMKNVRQIASTLS